MYNLGERQEFERNIGYAEEDGKSVFVFRVFRYDLVTTLTLAIHLKHGSLVTTAFPGMPGQFGV